MERSRATYLIVFFAGLFLTCLIFIQPADVQAESGGHTFSTGTATVQLSDGKTVEVTNDISGVLRITGDAGILYDSTIPDADIASIQEANMADDSYLIVEYRTHGTAQALQFDVLHVTNEKLERIYQSDLYEGARLAIDEEGAQLEVSYPKVEQDVPLAEPKEVYIEAFTVAPEQVTKADERTEPATNSAKARTFSASAAGYTNPSYDTISRKLTAAAVKYDVPPEIVKSIAFRESGWKQYTNGSISSCSISDGSNVVIGYDCIGIGIMQVSDYDRSDKQEIQKLMHDIDYNIDRGMQILKDKWNEANAKAESALPYNLIPKVNDGNPDKLENWYFAILAYNGRLERNDPIANPQTAYQELIYKEMGNQSLISTTPFPTHLLTPGRISGQLGSYFSFQTNQVSTPGPLHESTQNYGKGNTVYVTADRLTLRSSPNGSSIGTLPRGEKLTITGGYTANNSNVNHYVWYPVRTSSGKTGYVASGYLSTDPVVVHNLEGDRRNATSASISNYGWHLESPDAVVLGRSDLPIDAFTGSVLAAQLDSPLLLTDQDKLEQVTITEIDRLDPSTIYIVGAEPAISKNVENNLRKNFPESKIERVAGSHRYATSVKVAEEVASVSSKPSEIFLAVGDEKSPDALTIGPHAGSEGIPILLTRTAELHDDVKTYIKRNNIKKVTIIGSETVVSKRVSDQIKQLGASVERVEGPDRYSTNAAVITKYYGTNPDQVFFANGQTTVDSLSGAPLAAKYDAPIILTRPDAVTKPTRAFLNKINDQPEIFYLGSDAAITDRTRKELEGILQ
ncbi:Transglycosylase SLT domain-containing protein [Terribacillus halophilus]|uniref:Transglycosylase SLT domain-containing protein n=1 Tax=Terribacillus halophilus TaxID=361279 RepID=A0A1G6IEW0_9BACI|nr:cell wall-binding repeat-containing protein [Terribacillus halophilus]SDC04950.1 Transglycosylase SLT domain-containing protein [Terribacillus halophilus]